MDFRPIEMAALGRPLYPGMLYDCRTDSFIPGITLWDKKVLQDDLDVHRQPKTLLQFCTADSLSDKTNLMDVSSPLKASFLGGLVAVGGSAKYLHDAKSSSHLSRVIMHYSQTTRFEQLTMAELGKITYPQVFDQQTATHVVTGVLYGAQAFMVFDHKAANHAEKHQVKHDLHAVVKKIPNYCNEVQKMNENEKNLTEKVSVTFHGDYALQENPATYMEAMQVFKKLPNLLRDKEQDAVPVRVWLYPLKLLNEKAAILVRQVSEGLVSKAERMLGELLRVERRCNDLFQETSFQHFLDMKNRLRVFQEMHSDYKTALQKALFRVLPAIRSGAQEELVLANIVSAHYKTPFAPSNLNQWLDDFTTELDVLKCYINGLKDIRIAPSASQLNSILFDPAVDAVVCLSFTSLKFKDPYLDALKDFVNSEACAKLEQPNTKVYSPQATQPWYTCLDISKNTRQNLSLFTSFSKANTTQTKIQFIIASVPDPGNPGTSIQLYEKGKLTDPKFQPVSKPPAPTMEGAAALRLQKSPTGETVQFRVEYMKVKPGEVSQVENWESTETKNLQKLLALTGIQPGNQYLVRYRAVGVVGVGEASDSVRAVVQTSFTVVPPGVPFPPVVTDEDLIPFNVVGGPGGGETIFLTREFGGMLRMIRLTLGPNTVDFLTVTLNNNQQKDFAIVKGTPYHDFTFQDGDRFGSLTLWPNTAGNRLGGIAFEVVRKSGQVESFSAKIPNLGQAVPVNVGSGVCCGIKVRSGSDIDALGFYFIKQGFY